MPLGIVVEVAGRKMQKDFEPILERQIHYFINGAEGIQHIGQRDITWIRISKSAFAKGFRLEHLGEILHARIHDVFGDIVDKVQVQLFTDDALTRASARRGARRLRGAQRAHGHADRRVGRHLLLLHALPELRAEPRLRHQPRARGPLRRLQLARLQGLASRSTPRARTSRSPRDICIDPVKGEFSGPNDFVYQTLQPDSRARHPLLDHGGADDLLRLLRVHHGPRPRGQRRHDRQPRGPQHDALRHDLLHPGRHGRRRPADAGHDGHRQVLPDEQEVHPRRRRHQAHRLDVQHPQGVDGDRRSRRSASARASPTCSTRSPTRPWPPPSRSCCPSSRRRGTRRSPWTRCSDGRPLSWQSLPTL